MASNKEQTIPTSKEELAELIERLEKVRGRHTELVTVFVPAGYNLNNAISQIDAEKSTAKNIKSATTRKNVVDALERITRQLRLIGRTPKNGLAVFSGNVAEKEGQVDMQIWVIEPPEELGARLYRCDQVFVLDPLREIIEQKELYGLFVIERKEATIGLLEGKKIKILRKLESGVPGKIRAGGQSANRYERIIDGKARDFYKKCAIALKDLFFDMKNLKGIIIGGPMPTKDEFMKEGGLVTALREKVIGMKDIGYADEHGIELLVEASRDLLAEQEITREKKLLENFFNTLGKNRSKAAYGLNQTKKALEMAAAGTILISRKLPKADAAELAAKAEETSAEVEYVSMDTEEGQQFWNLSKGAGALLRFAVDLG